MGVLLRLDGKDEIELEYVLLGTDARRMKGGLPGGDEADR